MKRRGTLGVIVALALPADAQALTANQTVLVDRLSGGAPLPYDGAGRGFIQGKAISADGCYVLFVSDSDPLFAGDNDAARNLYRYSRCGAPQVVQVNTSSTGVPAEAGTTSAGASISDDGTRVAFQSNSRTLHPLADGSDQLYVKNLTSGDLELVSRGQGPDGAPVADLGPATISGDGQHVAFVAQGFLDTDNVNGTATQYDAYERSLADDTTHMVSVTPTDTPGQADFSPPGISKDGKVVSFSSRGQLVAGDTDSTSDAYVRQGIDVNNTDTTQLVSTGAGADGAFGRVDVSDDGTRVAWALSGKAWAALCSPTCGAATQLDVPDGGSNTTPSATDPTFGRTNGTAPGRVFFRTSSPLVPADTNGKGDLYARTFSVPTTTLLTDGTLERGILNASATDDAPLIAFMASTPELPGSGAIVPQAYVRVRPSGATTLISAPDRLQEAGDADITTRAVSADGRFVVFASRAPAFGGFVTAQNDPVSQVVLRDVVTQTTALMSAAPDGSRADLGASNGAIDAAGDKVVFASSATNLPGAQAPDVSVHVYVRDVASGAVRMLDVSGGGAPGDGNAFDVRLSANGTKAVFASSAGNLPGAPNDGHSHAYLADLATGALQIVDRANDGSIGNGDASRTDIDADGSRVAFVSNAENFGVANNGSRHAWVRDVTASTLTWVSVPQDGDPTHSLADDTFVSADGHMVAFTNGSPQFGYGLPPDTTQAFLRDLDTSQTTNLSAGLTGSLTQYPTLTGDASRATLAVGDFFGNSATFVRDVASGVIGPAAAIDGTTTAPSGPSRVAAISSTGSCVAFDAQASGLVPGGYGPDLRHVYLRALDASCLPPPGGGPGPGGNDTTPPVVSSFSVTNKRFVIAARKTAAAAKRRRAKRGTTFRFRLSENATVRIVIARRLAGRRKGKRCVAPTRKLQRAKRCSRFKTAHTLRRSKAVSGLNRVAYSGRVGKTKLRPGTHRATLVATDAAGNGSRARRISFRVVKR